MKVALVHDWLTGMRGGEYVLEAIADLLPGADVFTLISIPEKISPRLAALPIHTSWLQKVPGAQERYRTLLPLMPCAMRSFDLADYDLVVSSSHCVAKGARKAPGAVHVSYVHAPMRYMWARFDEYFGPSQAAPYVRLAASIFRPILQAWDRSVSGRERVDALIANSRYIAGQIKSAYGREASVVYPFADLSRFARPRRPGDTYLIVGAFAPYKRVDLAIEAFNRLGLPLAIVGSGQDDHKLRRLAGPTVTFLGALPNDAIAELYSTCKAFVFPGAEDFGITPLEAMAAGAPVIAFEEGGAMETVTESTGVFFKPQTVEAIMEAVGKIESGAVKPTEAECRARANEFSVDRFQREIRSAIEDAWVSAGKNRAALTTILRPR